VDQQADGPPGAQGDGGLRKAAWRHDLVEEAGLLAPQRREALGFADPGADAVLARQIAPADCMKGEGHIRRRDEEQKRSRTGRDDGAEFEGLARRLPQGGGQIKGGMARARGPQGMNR
jgi:hypothetical protein